MILALTLIIIIGGVWAVATISWLIWKLYSQSVKYDRQSAIIAAYKEGLSRPAYALLTQEQVDYLADRLSPKKEYIN